MADNFKEIEASGYRLPASWKGGAGPAENKAAEPFDVDSATREELEAEAAARGLTVTRADGKEGAPLVSDYRDALR